MGKPWTADPIFEVLFLERVDSYFKDMLSDEGPDIEKGKNYRKYAGSLGVLKKEGRLKGDSQKD
ncbi:MAG: hypothetical protein HZC18_07195 [Candidatus Omnitrophica bacterium]|nr:hypothetical protein [Candidatus Omnitrophota bacterium]